MNKTIISFSSSRRNGNTGALTDRIANALKLEVVDLGSQDITAYDCEHRNRNDDFEPLMEKVLGFNNIVFASPIYWYSFASPMKTFIDRISDYLDLSDLLDKGRELRGKTGYVICTSVKDAPDEPFIETLKKIFLTWVWSLVVLCRLIAKANPATKMSYNPSSSHYQNNVATVHNKAASAALFLG